LLACHIPYDTYSLIEAASGITYSESDSIDSKAVLKCICIEIFSTQKSTKPKLEKEHTSHSSAEMANWQPQLSNVEVEGGPIEGGPDGVKGSENEAHGGPRKKIVIVGLGMVGISFM